MAKVRQTGPLTKTHSDAIWMRWSSLGWKDYKKQIAPGAAGKFMANLASDNETELGEGYRELRGGEKILPTDEYYPEKGLWKSRSDSWSKRELLISPLYKPGKHCVTRRKVESDDQDFIAHLERASEIVAQWPEWKRNLMSDICAGKSAISYGGVVAAHRTPVTLESIISLLDSPKLYSPSASDWKDWLLQRGEMLETLKMTKPIC